MDRLLILSREHFAHRLFLPDGGEDRLGQLRMHFVLVEVAVLNLEHLRVSPAHHAVRAHEPPDECGNADWSVADLRHPTVEAHLVRVIDTQLVEVERDVSHKAEMNRSFDALGILCVGQLQLEALAHLSHRTSKSGDEIVVVERRVVTRQNSSDHPSNSALQWGTSNADQMVLSKPVLHPTFDLILHASLAERLASFEVLRRDAEHRGQLTEGMRIECEFLHPVWGLQSESLAVSEVELRSLEEIILFVLVIGIHEQHQAVETVHVLAGLREFRYTRNTIDHL